MQLVATNSSVAAAPQLAFVFRFNRRFVKISTDRTKLCATFLRGERKKRKDRLALSTRNGIFYARESLQSRATSLCQKRSCRDELTRLTCRADFWFAFRSDCVQRIATNNFANLTYYAIFFKIVEIAEL